MNANELINKDLIDLNLCAETKEEVIEKLANMMKTEGRILDLDEYMKSVLEREKIGTTGIGEGIAIPHGKSDTVCKTSVAIGRLKEEVEWDSLDGKPVKLVFLLAVNSKDSNNIHLKILSSIASMLMNDDIVKKLYNAKNNEEIIDLINEGINIEMTKNN